MPSIDEIRDNISKNTQPNGDRGFTFKVVARKTGVEINGHFVGPRERGWTSAAEHFGQYLARLAYDDLRSREGEASQAAREAAALAAFDVTEGQGLTMEQASSVFRSNGLDPRTSGAWAVRGYIVRDVTTDRRYITDKGRARLRELRQSA